MGNFQYKWSKRLKEAVINDADLLRKFKEVLEATQEVKKAEVAEYLGISEKELFAKLVAWREFGFKIKGDLIVVENLGAFVAALDQQFATWQNAEAGKVDKVENFQPAREAETAAQSKLGGISASGMQKKKDYHGTPLNTPEVEVLVKLEEILGKEIPKVDTFVGKTMLSEYGHIAKSDLGYVAESGHVTQLSLCDQGLMTVPEVLSHLTSLNVLLLSSNNISSLPEGIWQLRSLTHLYLGGTQITTLPEALGQLNNLQELSVGNQLKMLPQALGQLRWLTHLNLRHNLLQSLPDTIGNLQSLQYLHLDANQLTTLPETVGKIRKLIRLNIENNQLESLPKSLGQLTSLWSINFFDNQITSLPDSIGNLSSLEYMGAERNLLTSLPKSFGKLKNLKGLGLQGNLFESLPKVLLQLNLTFLRVDEKHYDDSVALALKGRNIEVKKWVPSS